MKTLAICLALLSAVALAVGTQLQNGAVGREAKSSETDTSHLTLKQLVKLIKQPHWISGAAISVLALALQFTALLLAPLILVQPIGAIALVITSILNAKITKTRLNKASITAICLCTFGLGAFVILAHDVAHEPDIDDNSLILILLMVGACIAIFGSVLLRGATKFKALTFIVGAGVLYGFVATLTKVVLKRLFNQDGFQRLISFNFEPTTDTLTLAATLCLIAAAFLGGWFLQNAYTSGPPDLAIAGLTVIDPLVAVSIGIVVLREAMNAPLPVVLGFVASGAAAVIGVYLLSKVHPELLKPVQSKMETSPSKA